MYKNFFSNKQYLDTLKSTYQVLFDNVYVRWEKSQSSIFCYKAVYNYPIKFYVKVDNEFIPVFKSTLHLSSRRMVMDGCEYLLNDNKWKYDNFPIVPAWNLPCTNYDTFFLRCQMSLSVYRREDWI